MADSDDDFENSVIGTKRHGSQSGRNKFRKEREDSTISQNGESFNERSSKLGMSFNNRDGSNKHRYNNNRRSDRSYSPPSRNERLSSPRRSNGYQQQHPYAGGHYNSNNRTDYGAFNSRYEDNGLGFKRSRSSYEGPVYNHASNFPPESQYFDSNSHKKLRRDWSVLEGPSHSKYYEHDNRSAVPVSDLDDLSEELQPQEYNRLNRPSNYSSYNNKFDTDYHHGSFNGNQNYYMPQNNNIPINNHPMQNNPMTMMGGGFRNQQIFPGFNNNVTPYMQQNMMFPMQQTQLFNPSILGNDRFFSNEYDGQTQPQMLSFKQFMAGLQVENNDIPVSQDAATKRYNDYKNSFRREQISLFYAVHKNEDWFRCRYHPDDSSKRKDEQRDAIKRRLKIFLNLVDKYCKKTDENKNFELSLDTTDEKDRQNLHKFIDACIIKLEDGSESDLDILEKIYSPNESTNVSESQSDEKTEINKSTIKNEDVSINNDRIEKHKVSDDESGMGSNDNSDDEEEEDENDASKTIDSKFDRKKKNKRKKNGPIVKEENFETENKSDLTENTLTELNSKDELMKSNDVITKLTSKETVNSNSEKKINKISNKEDKKMINIPHKTQSIFFKHLPVSVTRQDLEEIGKKFPGFKRASISEPAPERRFQRRGWITYDSTVDIKDVCSKINGLKLHEMLLNATINREIDQKVKCIIGLTNDKAIVRNDLKLIAKVVDNMDKRWGLWQYVDCYSNNKLNDEDFKLACDKKKSKESSKKKANIENGSPEKQLEKSDATPEENDTKTDLINENNDTNSPSHNNASEITSSVEVRILEKNPLVEEANEYLKYLNELNEDKERGEDIDNKQPNGSSTSPKSTEEKKTGEEQDKETNGSDKDKVEDEKSNSANSKSKTSLIVLNKTFKLEKDEKAAKLLDKLIIYLRIVHSIDYYNVTEYQQEDWMPNRCGILHARGSTETKSNGQSNIVNILNGMNINYFDPNALKKVQIEEWIRLFEISIKSYADYKERIDLEIARRLGLKDLNNEIEKYISSNCQKVEKDIWLCPLSGKKFKGPDYVRKHIETKHRERLLDLRKDVEYFNRFVLDPKRPYLPEHPLTKNMTMMNSQQQGGLPYNDYYRSNSNMYPGMQNTPFNQYQNSTPYLNQNVYNSQQKNNLPNQYTNSFNQYPIFNQHQQHHSNYNNNYSQMPHKPRR